MFLFVACVFLCIKVHRNTNTRVLGQPITENDAEFGKRKPAAIFGESAEKARRQDAQPGDAIYILVFRKENK